MRAMPPDPHGDTDGAGPPGPHPRSAAGPTGGTDRHPPSPGPLRIAFFTDSFEPTNDGVAKVTSTLARVLARAGHRVTVFTVRLPGTPRSEIRPDGVAVRRLRSVPVPSYPQYRIAVAPWFLPFSAPRFDVVHLHTPGFVGLAGWLAARRWDVPSVGTYHTNLTGLLRGAGRTAPSRAFFRSWSRFSIDLCLRCQLATAPSAAARSDLLGRAPPPSGRDPIVVPNGIDTERFRPGIRSPDWHRRLGIPADVPLLLFLGRLTLDKGAGRFVAALDRLDRDRPWFALVAGEGPLRPWLERRLGPDSDLHHRARLLGAVAEEEKPALLAQSRVFVLPSLSDTSSIALLEAMSCGVAPVVSSFGGPAEIARRSAVGTIVDPREPGRLAEAIGPLLREEPLARSFSERGRDWVVAHASAEWMARQFVEAYRGLRGREPPRGGTHRPGDDP